MNILILSFLALTLTLDIREEPQIA
jgi:hypothetical protein